jgi:hypothetical protein
MRHTHKLVKPTLKYVVAGRFPISELDRPDPEPAGYGN